eukprot:scaffold101_cov123-Cylindrotheca_fusiformis.AAC.19
MTMTSILVLRSASICWKGSFRIAQFAAAALSTAVDTAAGGIPPHISPISSAVWAPTGMGGMEPKGITRDIITLSPRRLAIHRKGYVNHTSLPRGMCV